MRLRSGDLFTATRKDRKILLREIADLADVTTGFLSQMVNNGKACTPVTAHLITAALGEPELSVEHLFVTIVGRRSASLPMHARSNQKLPVSA